jgi:hypothetical protein
VYIDFIHDQISFIDLVVDSSVWVVETHALRLFSPLRLSSFGCVALRDSPSVTYPNTLIGLTLERLPDTLKSFEDKFLLSSFSQLFHQYPFT